MVVIATFFVLGFYSYAQYRDIKAGAIRESSLKAKLVAEQFIRDVLLYSTEVDRTITANQLATEKRLRKEADETIKEYEKLSASDQCANSNVPDGIISILRSK